MTEPPRRLEATRGSPLSYTTSIRRPELQRPRRRVTLPELGMLGVFLLIAVAVAAFGSLAAIDGVNGWYSESPHVFWTPPNWAFGAVWSVLYLLIAVSGWLLWRRRARGALVVYVIQLAVNSLWTPVFFGAYPFLHEAALWIAVGIILVLDLLVVATIATAWRWSRWAALLLVPYLVWILYASTLNWGDAVLHSLG